LRLLVELFKLLRVFLVDAVQFYSVTSIFNMPLVALLWSINLVAAFKEVIINFNSQVNKHI